MVAHDGQPWRISSATVTGLLASAASAQPDRIYCKSETVTLTYGDTAGAVQALAASLGPEARGRTIGIVLPNSAAFLVAYFAVLEAGAAPALVNYAHPDATVLKLLERQDPLTVLTDRDIAGLPVTRFTDDQIPTGAAAGKWADTDPDAPGAILFSGGTTGLPKTVTHTQDVLLRKAERMEWGWPTREAEVWLPVAPFTHIYGFLTGVLDPLPKAGTVVIPPRFHPDLIVDMLADEQVTVFGGGPPAIYQAIMASAKFAGASFPQLRVCPGGGAPFPLAVHDSLGNPNFGQLSQQINFD